MKPAASLSRTALRPSSSARTQRVVHLAVLGWGLVAFGLAWHQLRTAGVSLRMLPSAALLTGVASAACLAIAVRTLRRARIGRRPALQRWAVHLAALALAVLLLEVAHALQERLVGPSSLPALPPPVRLAAEAVQYGVLLAWAWAGFLVGRLRRVAASDQHLKRSIRRATRDRQEAELRIWWASASPRVVQTALRSAVAQLPGDPAGAARALVAIADVLRTALLQRAARVPLIEEVGRLEDFARGAGLDGRIQCRVEPEASAALVPPLLLGVVVAEAVRHAGPAGAVAVEARRTGWYGRRLGLGVTVGAESAAAAASTAEALDGLARSVLASLDARTLAISVDRREARSVAVTLTLPWVDDGGDDIGIAWAVPRPAVETPSRLRPPALFVVAAVAVTAWRGARGLSDASQPGDALLSGGMVGLTLLLAWGMAAWRPLAVEGTSWRRVFAHLGALAVSVGLGLGSHVLGTGTTMIGWGTRVVGVAVLYTFALAVAHTEVFRRRRVVAVATWRALRQDRAAARLAGERLGLRADASQLGPHFVGNAVHAALARLPHDPVGAREVVDALVALLPVAERIGGADEIPLAEELAGLQSFLVIERARLGGSAAQLHLVEDVPEGVRRVLVPHGLLHPLVENAVRHGLAPTGRGGVIELRARAVGRRVVVEVMDDGVGLGGEAGAARAAGIGAGIGTSAIRRRLTGLYGEEARLELLPRAGGGTVARVELPLRGGTVGHTVAA